jgi:hypothetical protein
LRLGLVDLPGRKGQPGIAIPIDLPGAKVTVVAAVNDADDIAVDYAGAQGVTHGFVGYDRLGD